MSKILDTSILYNNDVLQRVGAKLFGRALRLRVAAWVLLQEGETFFQGEAAQALAYSPSAVAEELEKLVDLGMLIKHEKTPGDRRQYYSKVATPLWNVISAAVGAIEEQA